MLMLPTYEASQPKIGLVCGLFAIGSLLANAQVVGGINFGAAVQRGRVLEASSRSVVREQRDSGSQATVVQFAGAAPSGGIFGSPTQANVGIAGTGQLQASSVTRDSAYFEGSGNAAPNPTSE